MKWKYAKDCFAFRISNGRCRCDALIEMKCEGCKFYKSKETYKEQLKKYGGIDKG